MSEPMYRLRYILVGASGSGKSTMAHILETELGLRRCITSTTRPPRVGETDGVDYYFKKQLNPAELFEHVSFGDHEYGITKDELTRGDFIILEPQGVDYYRKHFPDPLMVIQLVRDNIHVNPERMARDRAAGFDRVHPDFVVRGETIEEMASNLIDSIRQTNLPLSEKLAVVQSRVPTFTGANMASTSHEVPYGIGPRSVR